MANSVEKLGQIDVYHVPVARSDSCRALDKRLLPCPVLVVRPAHHPEQSRRADSPNRSPGVLPTAFDARLSDLRYEPSDGWETSPCSAGSSQLARLICLPPQTRGIPVRQPASLPVCVLAQAGLRLLSGGRHRPITLAFGYPSPPSGWVRTLIEKFTSFPYHHL